MYEAVRDNIVLRIKTQLIYHFVYREDRLNAIHSPAQFCLDAFVFVDALS